jgi:3-oxoacyl-[acyl-carrier-protein] synthase III
MKLNSKMIGVGHYVPKLIVTNDDLSKIVDTNDEWIITRTGIKERRKVEHETTHEMAYLAALEAIKDAKISVDDIDVIIVATVTEAQKTPACANYVQGLLGIKKEIMSFDLNAACTGFNYALEIASSLLHTQPQFKHALVIGAETLSKVLDYTDRSTCILFGDGAGAAILSKETQSQSYFYNVTRPDMEHILDIDRLIKMDGRKVFLFAVEVVQKAIEHMLKVSGYSIDDIDHIIPHQANIRIIQAVAKGMSLPIEKFEVNIERYGNTSAASIPITLSEYKKKHTTSKRVLMVGFGGGFTYGASIMELSI